MKKTLFILGLILLALAPQAQATQYCETAQTVNISVGGQSNTYSFNVTYELVSGQYTITYSNGKNTSTGKDLIFDTERCYDNSSTSMKTWTIKDSGKTITKTFSSQPAAPKMYGYTYDGHNNKSFVDFTFPFPSDMTWGACAPASGLSITSATAGNITNTSADITVKAADTEGNINKVIIKNGSTVLLTQSVTPTTALDATYTITGLNKNTAYNLTVEVSDDASNTATKTVSFTTANNLESECSGSRGSSTDGSNPVQFEIMYDGSNVNFTIWSETTNMESCDVIWALSTSENTATTSAATISDGMATLSLSGRTAGQVMYVYFKYRTVGMSAGTNISTSNGTSWTSYKDKLIYYVVGDCKPPTNVPYIKYAKETGATSSSILLSVDAIVNNGANQVTQYQVTYGETTRILTAVDGVITVDELIADTEYTFTVKAYYEGNESENSRTIDTRTARVSQCEGTRGYHGYSAEVQQNYPRIDYKLTYDVPTNALTLTMTSHENKTLDFIKIEWNVPSIASATKEGTPTNPGDIVFSGATATYTFYPTANILNKAMAIMIIYSTTETGDNYQTAANTSNMTDPNIIYYIVGECGCAADDGQNPVMGAASVESVTATSVTLNVAATDNSGAVNVFVIDGKEYKATDGKLTIDGLNGCNTYNWDIYAKDPSCRVSDNYTSVSFETPIPTNSIVLNRPVYSGFDEGGLIKKYAVDGDRTTRWATNGRPTSDDEWLVIDLGGVYKINRIEVEWEYGTSINYKFQTGYTAEFVPNATSSGTWDKLVTGHFSTFDHRNEQPEGAKEENITLNEKGYPNADHVIDYYNYESEQVYGRYFRLESGLRAQYPSSLWEIRIFGECADISHKPVMQWAEVVSYTSDEAEIYVSALDYETPEERMDYKVIVKCGEPGYKQLETEYKFTYEQFVTGFTGHVMVGGLIPNMPYELKVYAIDEDGQVSDNYKTINFTTRSAAGCIFSSSQAYNVNKSLGDGHHSTQIFQKGYTITITPGENEFTITAETEDDFAELDPTIFQIITSDPNSLPAGGVEEKQMTKVGEDAKKYTTTISKNESPLNKADAIKNWSGTITFFIKFPFTASGICLTQPITYDLSNACESSFIIFHHDDQPTASSLIEYSGSTIESPIRYYRHFTAGVWEDITMPFDVENIMVYDTEDHQYYELKAQYKSGSTTNKGKFLLRKQQNNVSGENFVPSWYDGDSPLPTKHQPYAIRFTSNYYADKYVLFCGAKGQTIQTSFSKGATPTATDQYMVYGNPTMTPQSVGKAYLLPTDHSDETYRLNENATVKPFETYVLANDETMSVMSKIGPWRGTPAISTSLDEVTLTLTEQPIVELYTITGQRIGVWYDTTMQQVADECAVQCQAGCYLISAGGKTVKVIIR